MVTRIHAFGPNGELSPGAAAALAGLGGGGSTTVQIGTVTLPESPTEGLSVSVLADSSTVLPEDVTWDSGGEPTITERMLLVFVWSGDDWVGTYGLPIPAAPVPPDETGPTAGTLGVVVTSTTADGTVTGATDETEMHATPYSFRIDAGTWSAWQAGATYEWTGLTASTSYDFQHRVQDAAGNITEGTVVTDSTDAPSADTTDPTPGTLASSAITSESFTLTVTGASDETALHSQPYAFSTNNGSTWTGWQTSPSRNMTGLTAETEYTCAHKVRDAALNEATGSSITVYTTAASSSIFESFNKADGPLGPDLTWVIANENPVVVSNRATGATGGDLVHEAYADHDLTSANMYGEITIGNPGTTANHYVRLCLRFSTSARTYYGFGFRAGTGWQISKRVAGSFTSLASDALATPVAGDVIRGEVEGNTLRIYLNGTLLGSTTDDSITGNTRAGIAITNSSASIDTFEAGAL